MIIDVSGWGWAQWVVLTLMFLGMAITAAQHGNPRIDKSTNEPEKYNGFVGVSKFMFWMFLLSAGGFFA